jgi:hypothetical protein
MNTANLPKHAEATAAALANHLAGLVATAEASRARVKAHMESRDPSLRTPFRISRLLGYAQKDQDALDEFRQRNPE